MRTGRPNALGVAMILACVLPGCTVGKQSVLFLTNTGIALDVDSQPPSLNIG